MSKGVVSVLGVVVSVAVAALLAWAGSDDGLRIGDSTVSVFATGVILAFVVNWVAYVPSYLRRTERAYDLVGSITYLSVVLLGVVAGNSSGTAILLAVMVAVWALRLGTFLVLRISADGGDGRMDEIKQSALRFWMTWTLQALWVTVTVGAALAAMTASDPSGVGPAAIAGLVIWGAGFAIEVVADAQKRAFRRDPANDGRFIDSGLWAWSRHPNYFGEITLWLGVAIVAVPSLSGWQYVTLVSPLFVTLLLTRISGIPMLEARAKKRWGDEPAYQSYVARTPVLVPRPPGS